MAALPAVTTKTHLDDIGDDPIQARAEIADGLDKTNSIRAYLLGLFGSDGAKTTALTTVGAARLAGDNTFSGVNAFSKMVALGEGSAISSAAALDISAEDGNFFHVTGSVTVTSISNPSVGAPMVALAFDAALTLTHSASLILPGSANITTAAGDVFSFQYEGASVWRCVNVTKADGAAVTGSKITAGVPVNAATDSPDSIDFTAPAAGVIGAIVIFKGISTSGASPLMIQIGDGDGIETSAYSGYAARQAGSTNVYTAHSTGFRIMQAGSASYEVSGSVDLFHIGSNAWAEKGTLTNTLATLATSNSAGDKTLSAELTTIKITTVGGADTFDAGTINVIWIY